jgi:hypothetical protein
MDPMVQEWWIASNLHLDGSMKAVLSALAVTAVAFVVIFGLDKVAEPWRHTIGPWLVMAGLVMGVPSGKRLHNYGKPPFSMGKSTINGHFQ